MNHKIIAVTYAIKSHNKAGRFTVPEDVCRVMGIDKGARVTIEVESARGTFGPVARQLKSDREPQPVGEMKDWMHAGEQITVTVRRG